MRIIAGKFKGRRLQSPQGTKTRPTSERVRESVFNLLKTRCPPEGAHVLDLFCGTGAFGLEAISRGAEHVVFIELERRALRAAIVNAASLGVEEQCRFLRRDAMRYLKGRVGLQFEIIFADPPYDLEGVEDIPSAAVALLRPNGIAIIEHDIRHRFDSHPCWIESRSYGRTIVTIFRAFTS